MADPELSANRAIPSKGQPAASTLFVTDVRSWGKSIDAGGVATMPYLEGVLAPSECSPHVPP